MKYVIDLAYHRYEKEANTASEPDLRFTHVDDPAKNVTRIMNKDEFITACKTDDEMASRWVKPVMTDLILYLNHFVKGEEFPDGALDLKNLYPQTFDSLVDLVARCITLSDEDFRQIIRFK